MGKMAARLKKLFDRAIQEKVISLKAMSEARKMAAENIKSMPSVKELVDGGGDPLHAIYTNTLNLITVFGEQVTPLPPLHPIHDFIAKWQNTYVPGFPPWSPVSNSYFTCWTMLDAAFGEDRETIGTCFLSLVDRLPLNPIQIEVAKNLNQSRMGIYEVLQTKGQFFQLRELITDKKITAFICSGYVGSRGDLIFVRLVPPLADSVDYFVGLTTPYQFVQQSEEDWLQYFKRHDINPKTVGVEARLHRHLKYGKNRTYWSEYIFYGYSNFGPGVILMTGFPDQPKTQPQHDKYQQATSGRSLCIATKDEEGRVSARRSEEVNEPPALRPNLPEVRRRLGWDGNNADTSPTDLLHGRAVSEVFQEYIEPLAIEWRDMKPRPSIEELNDHCRTPWMIWNAVVYEDYYPKSSGASLLREMRKRVADAPNGVRNLIDSFVERKRTMFGEFRYLFGEAKFYTRPDGEIRCRAEAKLP